MILDRAETMSRDERAALQSERLRGMIDRLLAADGLQARRLRESGVDSGKAVELDDLPRLPTTSKPDLWEHYPLGLLAVPMEQVTVVHGSSGTGGRPTLVGYTAGDIGIWSQVMARSLAGAGATPASIIHNAYGYGLFTGGLGVHQGAQALGATVVPMSGGMTARQIRMILDLAPDVLTCTPSYAVYLGEALRAQGIGREEIPLKVGIHGAEPWTDALRAKIERLLPIRALDIYGLSEVIGPGVACETLDSDGWLHVQEDHFLVETLDPATGAPTPPGVPGELSFTTVTKEALPLLRYRTGDLATLDRTPSRDGRTTVRMSKITGRVDDMLVVRGVNVYPSEIEAVLLADRAVSPHYLLVLDGRGGAARLVVACEAASDADGGAALDADSGAALDADGGAALDADGAGLAGRVDRALRERLGLRCDVRVLPAGTVPRVETGKAVRVARWQDGDPPLPGLE
jgi:phenylacetate-CoA ligase